VARLSSVTFVPSRSARLPGVDAFVDDATPEHFFGPTASQRSKDFLGLIRD
jgi:hypothetical protein